jgi:hypothetical protein
MLQSYSVHLFTGTDQGDRWYLCLDGVLIGETLPSFLQGLHRGKYKSQLG